MSIIDEISFKYKRKDNENMDEKLKNAIALFRYGTLSPLITGQTEFKDPWTYFRNNEGKKFEYIDGTYRTICPSTLDRWYKAYKEKGFDGLKPHGRSDIGIQRKIDDELKNIVLHYVNEYPRLPATQIYEKLLSNGDILKKDISLSTVTRFVTQVKKSKGQKPVTEYKRYEKEHINEVWYGDTTYGPYINVDGEKKRVYIIAFIDDASRLVTSCIAFFEDNYVNLMQTIKKAVSTYGKPKVISVDNGSNYRSNQMELLGARIGVAINYCPPYTPMSKSKIERFFRTLKDQYLCLIKPNDYHDIESFNNDLRDWIQKYNTRPHSSLKDEMSPNERFFKEGEMIKWMSPEEIERSFLLEYERTVSADNIISIENKEYEVNYHYASSKITVRYSPDLSKVYVVDKEDNSLKEIKLLDKTANGYIKREKIRLSDIES